MVKIAIPQMGTDLFRIYMKSKYEKSLRNAGAETVWIELDDVPKAAAEVCTCDGLLLPGGGDLDPQMYGEEKSAQCGEPNIVRDAAEPEILETFLKTGKPVFGICRGIQLLNVVLGGTLYQDIKGQQKVKHSDFAHRAASTHEVSVEAGTKLAEIMGVSSMRVNSIHHQAIKALGNGLIVSAKSEDGFVEAVELSDYGFCVGVQWHPEHMTRRDEVQRRLFEEFVKEARSRG